MVSPVLLWRARCSQENTGWGTDLELVHHGAVPVIVIAMVTLGVIGWLSSALIRMVGIA